MAMVRNFEVMFHRFQALVGFNNVFHGTEIDHDFIWFLIVSSHARTHLKERTVHKLYPEY
jgi:hypothetical protein